MLAGSMTALAVVSLLTPLAGGHGDEGEGEEGEGSGGAGVAGAAVWLLGVALARVAIGVVQGVIFPSVHTLLAEWIAPHARSRCVSVAMSGMYLGSALAMLAAPVSVESIGAEGQLKTHAFAAILWLAAFVLVFPHTTTPPGAKPVLPVSLASAGVGAKVGGGGVGGNGSGNGVNGAGKRVSSGAVPWGGMLRSPAVWAIIVNNFGYHYLVYVLVSWQPTYFQEALGVRLAGNKFASAGPYFVMTVCTTAGGLLSDALIARGYTVASARKTINSAGFAVATLALLIVPAQTGAAAAAGWIALALGAAAVARGGFAVNHMDIAPRHAGVLMGLSNSAGTLAGVVGVKLTGTILEASGGTWAPVFHVAAAICAAVAGVFAVFGRGERLFS